MACSYELFFQLRNYLDIVDYYMRLSAENRQYTTVHHWRGMGDHMTWIWPVSHLHRIYHRAWTDPKHSNHHSLSWKYKVFKSSTYINSLFLNQLLEKIILKENKISRNSYLEFVTNKTLLIPKYVFHYLNDDYKNIILLYHLSKENTGTHHE